MSRGVYVDPDRGTSGDGTTGAPFTSIGEALAQRGDRDIVVLAAGQYDEAIRLSAADDGLTLVGRCSEGAIINGGEIDGVPTILVEGTADTHITLRGLTLTGGFPSGLRILGGSVSATDLAVHANRTSGILVRGPTSSLSLSQSLVDDTRIGHVPAGGTGVAIEDGATASLSDITLRRNHFKGLAVRGDGTQVVADNLRVSGTDPTEPGTANSNAITVWDGASFRGEYLALVDDHYGIMVSDEGTVAAISSSEILEAAQGIVVVDGALSTFDHGTLANVGRGGVALGRRARLHLTNTVLSPVDSGVEALEDGYVLLIDSEITGGLTGAWSDSGSYVEGERLKVSGARDAAVFVSQNGKILLKDSALLGPSTTLVYVDGADSVAELHRSLVHGGRAVLNEQDQEYLGGFGALASHGAYLELQNTSVVDNQATGILLHDPGTRALLRGVDVGETLPNPDHYGGYGVVVADSAMLDTDGLTIDNNESVGLFVHQARATLSHTRIAHTRRGVDFTIAQGLLCQANGSVRADHLDASSNSGPGLYTSGCTLSCTHCTVQDNRVAGLSHLGSDTITIDQSQISDNLPDATLGGGVGLLASVPRIASTAGADIRLTRTQVGPHELAGIWLSGMAALSTEDSAIQGGQGLALVSPAASTVLHGNAIFAIDAEPITVSNSSLNGGGGPDVLLHHTTGTFLRNSWGGAVGGLHQQACESLPVAWTDGPHDELCSAPPLPYDDTLSSNMNYREVPPSL